MSWLMTLLTLLSLVFAAPDAPPCHVHGYAVEQAADGSSTQPETTEDDNDQNPPQTGG